MFTITINAKTPEEFKEGVKLLHVLFPEDSKKTDPATHPGNRTLLSYVKELENAGRHLVADAKELVKRNEQISLENSLLRGKIALFRRAFKENIG